MTLDDATAVIGKISYKPGWTFTPTSTANGLILVITPPDGSAERVPLPRMSLPSLTTRQLAVWVLSGVRDLEVRRAEKAFTYAGQGLDEIEGP